MLTCLFADISGVSVDTTAAWLASSGELTAHVLGAQAPEGGGADLLVCTKQGRQAPLISPARCYFPAMTTLLLSAADSQRGHFVAEHKPRHVHFGRDESSRLVHSIPHDAVPAGRFLSFDQGSNPVSRRIVDTQGQISSLRQVELDGGRSRERIPGAPHREQRRDSPGGSISVDYSLSHITRLQSPYV